MRKFFAALALLALAMVPTANAQSGTPFGAPLGDYTAAVDTDPAILFWYVGDDTTGTATVTVAAGGDVSFDQGGAADTTVECPLSGAYGGIIDVSDAACDTLGEIVNVVNGTSGSEWRAAIVNGLASDSSNDTFLAVAATEARGDGYAVLWDSSVKLSGQVAFFPGLLDSGNIKAGYFAPNTSNRGAVNDNPFSRGRQVLKYAAETITSSGTIGQFAVSCVVPKGSSVDGNYAETVTTTYTETGAASTSTGKIDEFNYAGGGLVCEGGKFLIRQSTGTDLTAQVIFATGFNEKSPARLP